jgi:hypothetical protein
MGKFIDLTGQRFGKWKVLRRSEAPSWFCCCDCGTERDVDGGNLRSGVTNGCGCNRGQSNITHGHTRRQHRTRTYSAWESMRYRVLSPASHDAANYRDRGIGVDPRWDRFEAFLADMGECPVGLSLERINNDRGYGPDNCKWATRAEQNRNTRRTRWVLVRGQKVILRDAARMIGRSEAAIYQRMKRKNISIQEAIDQYL